METLKGLLAGLQSASKWTAGLILALLWASFQNNAKVPLFSIQADRDAVFVVSAVILLTICLAQALYYHRIGIVLAQTGEGKANEAIEVVSCFPWLLNPFTRLSVPSSWSDNCGRIFTPVSLVLGCGALLSVRVPEGLGLESLLFVLYFAAAMITVYSINATARTIDSAGSAGARSSSNYLISRPVLKASCVGFALGVLLDWFLFVAYSYF